MRRDRSSGPFRDDGTRENARGARSCARTAGPLDQGGERGDVTFFILVRFLEQLAEGEGDLQNRQEPKADRKLEPGPQQEHQHGWPPDKFV